MKVLLFNGALDRRENSVSERICKYFQTQLNQKNIETTIFNIAESNIPILDISIKETPREVLEMNKIFVETDLQIWFTPLYHGSLTGAMKNAIDWLEISAKLPRPYLTGKRVGLVSWADGMQAMQGINAMESIVKALRAWPLPYSVPVQRPDLFTENQEINAKYETRFKLLIDVLLEGPNQIG